MYNLEKLEYKSMVIPHRIENYYSLSNVFCYIVLIIDR